MDDEEFLTDAEIAKRWRIDIASARLAICVFEKDPRFPKKDNLLENKRYWPAVKAFMRHRYGLILTPPSVVDGREDFNAVRNRKNRWRRPTVATPSEEA